MIGMKRKETGVIVWTQTDDMTQEEKEESKAHATYVAWVYRELERVRRDNALPTVQVEIKTEAKTEP